MAFCDNLECWQLTDGNAKFCKDHVQSGPRLDLSGIANVQLHHTAPPHDEFSKAVALTQNAINNLGGPIHASMIDHKPVDVALAQALTQTAISHGGERHADADKLPADRALAEALTLNAIQHQPQDKLKQTGRRSSLETGLTSEQQTALLAQAQEEKNREKQAAAKPVLGGGDAKEAMKDILGEINNQGVISVPRDKIPDENITLNQMKTMQQINALQDHAPNLSHTDQPVDHALVQARTMKALAGDAAKGSLKHVDGGESDVPLAHGKVVYAIDHMGEPNLKHDEHKLTDATLAHEKTLYAIEHHRAQSVPSDKAPTDKAIASALTLNALKSETAKAGLKPVDHPQEGLTKEEIASLQAAAQQEKSGGSETPSAHATTTAQAGGEAEPTPVIHMPKD